MKLGEHVSPELRAKLSAAKKGKRASLETRMKMSMSAKGRVKSPETCARLSAALMGKTVSAETRAKQSEAHWKGGKKVSGQKHHSQRRLLGFVPLNKPLSDCVAHHVDNERVIYMPQELHRSIFHRQRDDLGMAKINAVAYNFLFKQEVEAALEAQNARSA
jgi:hypothetical protein